MSSQTVLVTGGTGFIGSHIIAQLLETNYTIRATARSAKKLQGIFPDVPSSKLQVVEIPDLESDHTEALKGVHALIHVATPSHLKGNSLEDVRNGAYHGAIGIVTTALKLGITKIIVTATAANLLESDFSNGFGTVPVGPETWGSITYEDIDTSEKSPGGMYVYQAAKTAAERKIWELADEYKSKGVDITTILPTVVFGPYIPNFYTTSSPTSLGTNEFLFQLLDTPDRSIPENALGMAVDVRDVARAHILALSAPPLPDGQHKRLIVNAKHFTWTELIKTIRDKYPNDKTLDKRLPTPDAKPVVQINTPIDVSLTNKALPGFGGYTEFDQTLVDAFEAILAWEKQYKSKD